MSDSLGDLELDPGRGNPLVALAIAIVKAFLYILGSIRYMVGWVTITLPGMIVRMLQYSFTISLTFPVLLTLFLASCGAAIFVIRYRYLARYTLYKELALPLPSPPSIPTDLSELGLGDAGERRAPAFHNYLDDFLAAIRIFGYLEKPVFHELSRHLQTRRLAAGETLEIGNGDFWCVVEGKVQVFAPSTTSTLSQPPSPDPFGLGTHKAFNGYHLLNEVSTGGTLSSLFSILNLFTEDIKLPWDSPPSADGNEMAEEAIGSDEEDEEADRTHTWPKKSRANSDVSQLDVGDRASPESMTSSTFGATSSTLGPIDERPARPRSSSLGSTVRQDENSDNEGPGAGEASSSAPATKSPSPILSPSLPGVHDQPPASFPPSPLPRTRVRQRSAPGERRGTAMPRPKSARHAHKSGAEALKGTIARATVDTTLAVIPAEAFRRLTRKYPKASGTVVQVVLERFSRVTFMTAHKFLGLTREILRSESSLNALVSHPLPRAFYTGGGMQALRDRFHPPPKGMRRDNTSTRKNSPDKSSKDYFNFVPVSPTVRAPSLPSDTPKNATTPATYSRDLSMTAAAEHLAKEGVPPPEAAVFSPDTAARQSSAFVRQNSAMRKQVAAGDLAMTRATQANDNGGAYYRHTAQTPGLPRMDTWRGRMSASAQGSHKPNAAAVEVPLDLLEDEYELREAVLTCIAKSIGLVQPQSTEPTHAHDHFGGRSSFAPSVSNLSTPNSPMFPPHMAHRPKGASPSQGGQGHFGNVLDMMNASNHNDNLLGGMLREAVMKVKNDEDASSISASIQESSAFGGEKNVLRDLEGHVEVFYYKKGTALVKEGEKCPGLYYVIDGFLEVSLPVHSPSQSTDSASFGNTATGFSNDNSRPFSAALGLDDPQTPHKPSHSSSSSTSHDEPLFTVKPGGIAGYLSSLCHTDSYVTITAKTDCYVGYLPNHALERILERRPIVLLTLAKRLMSLLSPLVLHIDAALDWIQLGAREVLYEKGDKATDFYIVINGRLRSLNVKGDSTEVVREHGQGDSIGELEVITGVNRSETVHAIRDSELVRIPAALFDAISTRHPATTVQFLRLIAGRVRKAVGEQALPTSTAAGGPAGGSTKDMNLKTVCIIGANRNVPVAQFAGKLKTSLEELGASTSYLDQGTVMRHLGRHAFARIGKLKIAGWLADQEQHHRTVLYVADTPPASQWTLTCIRQADLVLILAMGDEPALGEYEKLLLATKTTARKELILLHDERTVAPGSTRPWLINRPWIHAHHHVELPGIIIPHKARTTIHDPAAIAAFKHLREEVKTRLKAYRGLRPLGRPRRPPHLNDFARLARRICGKSIGLCLGGGGARGVSHIGMLQALEEYGIPIDAIAGCSIGSFVGGLYSRETDLLETTGRTKQFAGRMGSVWRILSDVTYPFAAYTTGHEFNRGIYKAFFNTHIEDFWIPFFANSTNITHSRMEIHRTGYAWRYVRASMTLAGLLPPFSDNGNLLVDGGYMDNTPIGPLQSAGIRDIFVVDVGGLDDTSPRNYGDSVSGWWILLNRFNPFYKRNVLSMTEVSSRLAYVSSYKTLEEAKSSPGCLYIAMPVQQFDTLGGFKSFPEVLKVGLEAGREQLRKWKAEGVLPTGLVDESRGATAIRKGNRLRRMSI